MKTNLTIYCLSFIFLCAVVASGQKKSAQIESVYTSLDGKNCKTLESSTEEAGWYLGECKGVGGFKLQISEGDIRQSIDVIAPNKKKHALDFQQNVSFAFSYVGAKAEWRVTRSGKSVTPFALIVRFNASENSEKPDKETSYLVVSKITKNDICVTNVVQPGANANEEARQLADASTNAPCKSSAN